MWLNEMRVLVGAGKCLAHSKPSRIAQSTCIAIHRRSTPPLLSCAKLAAKFDSKRAGCKRHDSFIASLAKVRLAFRGNPGMVLTPCQIPLEASAKKGCMRSSSSLRFPPSFGMGTPSAMMPTSEKRAQHRISQVKAVKAYDVVEEVARTDFHS